MLSLSVLVWFYKSMTMWSTKFSDCTSLYWTVSCNSGSKKQLLFSFNRWLLLFSRYNNSLHFLPYSVVKSFRSQKAPGNMNRRKRIERIGRGIRNWFGKGFGLELELEHHLNMDEDCLHFVHELCALCMSQIHNIRPQNGLTGKKTYVSFLLVPRSKHALIYYTREMTLQFL